jgi:hypothetical protein
VRTDLKRQSAWLVRTAEGAKYSAAREDSWGLQAVLGSLGFGCGTEHAGNAVACVRRFGGKNAVVVHVYGVGERGVINLITPFVEDGPSKRVEKDWRLTSIIVVNKIHFACAFACMGALRAVLGVVAYLIAVFVLCASPHKKAQFRCTSPVPAQPAIRDRYGKVLAVRTLGGAAAAAARCSDPPRACHIRVNGAF